MSDPAELTLESYLPQFGLSAFRAGQREVISTVLAGRDCLCVMPTGGGKSLCYQLPAIAGDGLTLVISPLIALMKDQVDQLQALGLPVSFINSALPAAEQYARLDRLAAGEFRLIYVSPERFRSGRFLEVVRAVRITLLAVDEAHCISEWGHDFRPDYARLGYFRRLLGNPPTIALTATATDRVRRDVVEQLNLREPSVFITGFARPNLIYEVQRPQPERRKTQMFVEFLRRTPGAGIIYTSTRKRAEEVAETIADQTRRRAVVYHAGMLPDQRRKAQDDFMQGRCEIVVATNAFGMGIDKADVRFVVHYNIPGSVEAYYQEAGRAGRDGRPSHCLMLYSASDRYIQEYFIDSAYPDREHVQAVYEFLRGRDENPIEMTQDELKQALGLPIGSDGVGNCEQLLEGAGVLERLIASQNQATVRIDSDLPTLVDLLPKQAKVRRKVLHAVERIVGPRRQELVQFNLRDLTAGDELDQASIAHALRELNKLESFTYVPPFRGRAIRMIRRDLPFERLEIDFEAHQRRKDQEREKLDRVVRFALSGSCRQGEILRYFGEKTPGRCGRCDNCRLLGEGRGMGTSVPVEAGDAQVLEAVRMVLSGVARTQARFPCGRNLIAQMLCGSGSAKLTKLRLNKLSTFGLLKHLKQSDVLLMIDALVALGCLRQVDLDRFRPVVELTEFGDEVMKGKASLPGELPLPAEVVWKLRGSGEWRVESGEKKRERESKSDICSPLSTLHPPLSPWHDLAQRVLEGHRLTFKEGLAVLGSGDEELLDLLAAAYRVRHRWFGNRVDLNFLVNAKSGQCSEDCGYCSQSRISKAEIPRYGLITAEQVLDGARLAAERRAKTYCTVISGRAPSDQELELLGRVVPEVKATYGLKMCFSVGLLTLEQARRLKVCGVDRINHNLNTSERFYPHVCTTHSYQDRLDTLQAVRRAGLEICSGGIVGMGEEDADVVELALRFGQLQVEAVPINFLLPIAGTPLAGRGRLNPRYCLKVLALFRLANPRGELRVAAGRELHLGPLQPLSLYPANSIFVGDYLTTEGQPPEDDYRMIEALGFAIGR